MDQRLENFIQQVYNLIDKEQPNAHEALPIITKFVSDHFETGDVASQEQADLKELLANALYTDAAHHKQWYLWRIAEKLGLDLSDQWDEEYPKPEKGVAP